MPTLDKTRIMTTVEAHEWKQMIEKHKKMRKKCLKDNDYDGAAYHLQEIGRIYQILKDYGP